MSFDKETRNLLAKTVTACRRRLIEDVTDQLRGVFGLHPDGAVLPLDKLMYLSPDQAAAGRRLRDLLDHYTAGVTGPESDRRKAAYGRMVLEISFTVLNRLAALRLSEERGLVVDCVRDGMSSDGFQMFERISGGAIGARYETYRVFLECLFDELALDLGVLFDRLTPPSAVFPTERCMEDVLAELNKPGLTHLWAEDETIGWIYQYFNPLEERKAMREASHAPRNSRELAVRNQFFTPRYVVEFLLDNSLGRLWFNARAGETELREKCRMLVVSPRDRAVGQNKPPDPRTVRMLDPACGSMHFGLYAFDLLTVIYREAWHLEESNGPDALDRLHHTNVPLEPLRSCYRDRDAFIVDMPRLILEHNLCGVDIDPRAVQISALALWLRAQRAWRDLGVKAKDRPVIERINIVAAAPPPKDSGERAHFISGMDETDGAIFEKTLTLLEDVAELGVILRAERELAGVVRSVVGQYGELFAEGDRRRWSESEDRLRKALAAFAAASGNGSMRRLFAADALEDLRFLDLLREPFDVVVMNPPFGVAGESVRDRLVRDYPRSKNDLLAVFVERGLELLAPGGFLGAITSRTAFFLSSFTKWREEIVLGAARPVVFADLGYGVMDSAMVEAAAYVLEKASPAQPEE